ncbi:16S rRNA (cytidine(1402)-2'-O)-methyltransferase [Canibacter sp. lx-45]|uniref:16S rRNA (cytidine(1402)-2'-O)-methyltransferase n=1 Tax=Canibacter zhuwentaonis TaxID=2837491 RepID=UPI001BDCFF0E|nr:16S rRNA (cytidine(1402)-2'-O)-methyltransferase [Canibacter zhuwentaonis]MBT1034772.1 16S rRNA (cytidine(1402)-2'-O)-methyltransferase [Canibacter zhuwentaonis]
MLTIAATPIGNLQDASPRLCAALQAADIIAAEDTRKTRQLLRLLEITTGARLVALHDHNEQRKAAELAALALESEVVLVSDAGMPTVADPGFRVVAAAVAHDVAVTVIPGPSAALAALAISGIATDRFAFEGFLPRKQGALRKRLAELASDSRTLVFFESPKRVLATITEFARVFGGDRRAAVCRELTKMHEQVVRGPLRELADNLSDELRGEVVLVVAGADAAADPQTVLEQVLARVAAGERLKDAAREAAKEFGVPARELYEMGLQAERR